MDNQELPRRHIQKIVPVDWFELIIVLNDGEKRIFSKNADMLKSYEFLAFPDKLRAFSYGDDFVEWEHGLRLNLPEVIQCSEPIKDEEAKRKSLSISRKNQAPTNEHPRHHVYDVSLKPFDSDKLFVLSESIGGGHADTGGSRYFSLAELIVYPGWKAHFEMADCDWGIDFVKKWIEQPDRLIEAMLEKKASGVPWQRPGFKELTSF